MPSHLAPLDQAAHPRPTPPLSPPTISPALWTQLTATHRQQIAQQVAVLLRRRLTDRERGDDRK
jgi:hypothetical protein